MPTLPCAFSVSLFVLLVMSALTRGETPRLRDAIDQQVESAWKKHKATPTRLSTDAEFLRRVYLDLVGSVPTYDETVAFLEAKDADKRDKLIDKLLADRRFAGHQADIWDMVLFGRNPPGYETQRREGFQTWLRTRFEKGIAYDVWVKELLRAEGNSVENGALYYAQYSNQPQDATEAISQTFLGVQLQCARCHDHPYEEWKQVDFYGIAAFLARLQVVQMGKKDGQTLFMIGEHESGDIQFTGPAKDAAPGKKGEPIRPKFLNGSELEEPAAPKTSGRATRFKDNVAPPRPKFSRKDKLADWITDPSNPYFARAVANRVWAQYMGRGLVHPVDNLSPSNEPTIPELLQLLARDMVTRRFDLKGFIRELVSSKTYQLAAGGTGEPMPRWYESARTRPLSAVELAEAWRITTGYAAGEKATAKPGRFRPLDGYFLGFFGSPNTGTGDFQGGLREHLYMNNGPLSLMIGSVKGGLAEFVGDAKKPVAARVERLYVQTLQRKPTAAERDKFIGFLEKGGSGVDAVWVLITSSEFRFNH